MATRLNPVAEDPESRSLQPNAESREFAGFLGEGRRRLEDMLQGSRKFAKFAADHYATEIVVGVGAVAFIVGVVLRVRRSNRYGRDQIFWKWRA